MSLRAKNKNALGGAQLREFFMDAGSLAIFLGFRDGIKKLDDRPLDLSFLATALYEEAKKRGADSNLLSLIGSWGDTLSDRELLEILNRQ